MKKIMEKYISLKIALIVTVLFSFWWSYGHYKMVGLQYKKIEEGQIKDIYFIHKYISNSLKNSSIEDISEDLKNRIIGRELMFYAISEGGKIKISHHFREDLEKHMLTFPVSDKLLTLRGALYKMAERGDVKYVFGTYFNRGYFIKKKLQEFYKKIVLDMFILFLICFLVVEAFVKKTYNKERVNSLNDDNRSEGLENEKE